MSNKKENKESPEMEIRVIKFKTGEEIVTVIEGVMTDAEDKQHFKCLDPAYAVRNPQDENAMAFVPWMMFAEDRIFVLPLSEMLIAPVKCEESVLGEYKKYFAKSMEQTDLVKASKKSVIATPKSKIIQMP